MLSLKGFLTVIGRDKFIFKREDIISYYGICGVKLEAEEAEFLFKKTEGWISALYLYLLRYAVDGVIAFPVNIYELIDREMFSWFSDELKRFLYAISPFKSFTYEQADFVWAGDNTHELLKELRFKNTFVTYNDITRQFYIHSIFQQFLGRVVARLPEEERLNCYGRCGDWYFHKKEYLPAIRYYDSANQFDAVMRSIEEDRGKCMSAREWPFFSKIMERCPENVKIEHAAALLFVAIRAFLINDGEVFENCCRTLQKAADSSSQEDKKQILKGMLMFTLAFREFNRLSEMRKKFLEAGESIQETMEILIGQDSLWTLGAPSLLLLFHRDSGRLDEEVEEFRSLLEVYGALTRHEEWGVVELMEAENFFFQGKEEQARIKSFAAEQLVAGGEQASNLFYVKFLQFRMALVAGDRASVNEKMDEMEQMAQSSHGGITPLWMMMELYRGFYYSFLRKGKQIPYWIRSGGIMSRELTLFAYPFYQIIYGKSLLLEGSYEKLIGVFQVLLNQELYTRHTLFVIYGEIYLAAAQYGIGWESQAFSTLRYGLDVAMADNLILPFAENYRELAPLIEMFTMMEGYKEAASSITKLAGRLEEGLICLTGAGRQKKNELLTERERQMAKLASLGKTNGEIALELCLAGSTVKRTMVNIFRKLEIHNREELKEQGQWFED